MRGRCIRVVLALAAPLAVTAASIAAAPAVAAQIPAGAVWVADEGGNSLTVLDAGTGEVRATVSGVPAPHNVQASPDGTSVYAVSGGNQLLSLTAARAEVTGLALTDRHPAHVVAAEDGTVLVTASEQPSLYAYDARLRPVRRVSLDGAPHGLRISADGRTAVVANTGAGTVDVVDTTTGAVTGRVAVGPSPVQVAVSPDGAVAYASVSGTREVVRVDLATGQVVDRRAVPAAPAQVHLTPDGLLLVANQGDEASPGSTLSVLDAATLEVRAEIPVGAGPHGITVDGGGSFAWVTNVYDDSVSMVDLQALRTVRTATVGDAPNGISFTPVPLEADVDDVRLELPAREDGPDGHDHGGGAGHSHGESEDSHAPDWSTWGRGGAAAGAEGAAGHDDAHGDGHGTESSETEPPRALVLGGFGAVNALVLLAAALWRRRRGPRRA